MSDTLPPLLQQLVPPLFQLRCDSLDTGVLLDVSGLGLCSEMIAHPRIWLLHDRADGSVIDSFAEYFQHFNCSANFGCVRCSHNQMRMPREGLRTSS